VMQFKKTAGSTFHSTFYNPEAFNSRNQGWHSQDVIW